MRKVIRLKQTVIIPMRVGIYQSRRPVIRSRLVLEYLRESLAERHLANTIQKLQIMFHF